jgi:argininosuccinate lyase
MSRLWDKGAPLDERVLHYTAGEDHALDERLVAYDARASIAHAQMLHDQGLLSSADCEAIEQGLEALAAAHAQGAWRIELADEDGQTALEKRLTALIGAAGGRVHLGRSRNDQVLAALRLYMRDASLQLAEAAEAVAPWNCGRAALPQNCVMMRRAFAPCSDASAKIRSALRQATARPVCRSIAKRPAKRSISRRCTNR